MSFRKPMSVAQIRCFRLHLLALLVSQSALNAGEPSNGNTNLTVIAADNAWIGKTSPKQLSSCLRSNSLGYIFSYPASALYPLAAFGYALFPPQFFFISLLTFYLQTSSDFCSPQPPCRRDHGQKCFFPRR